MKIDIQYQKLSFPFLFEISENPEKDFKKTIKKWLGHEQKNEKIIFLCGSAGNTRNYAKNYIKRVENIFQGQLSCLCVKEISVGSIDEACEVDYECAKNDVTVMIALGGGKVIDVAKAVVAKRNINLIIIPSVLSSDCIASPISVLIGKDGKTKSLPSGMPSAIFIDLTITTAAPKNLNLSGVGDIVSNYSALLDFDLYESMNEDMVISGLAKILSKSSADIICSLDNSDIVSFDGHKKIATSLMLSGFAMSFAGNSLPCSGAEHMISHSIDAKNYGYGTHGFQVAVSTIYCSNLRKILNLPHINKSVLNKIQEIGLPTKPSEIGISKNEYLSAVYDAHLTRPGRVTVLSMKPSKKLLEEAFEISFD